MAMGKSLYPFNLVHLMVLACCVLCDGQVTSPSTRSSTAFFNGNSQILLPSIVLRFNKHIAFTFRTCSPGKLLYQEGSNGSNFTMAVTENGGISLTFNNQENSLHLNIGEGLTDNQWYTVDSNFENGVIQFSVERGKTVKYRTLISNSTYNRFVWDMDLSGGTPVYVGLQLVGCVQEGPSVRLSAETSQWMVAQPGACPLEDDLNYGNCQEELPDPCWEIPCKNGGTCESTPDRTNYTCTCVATFRGQNCETDIGNEACAHSICQNGGTCQTLESGSGRTYECICAAGFRGLNCEINIDECASGPCKNDANCVDMVNGYVCQCDGTGYAGQQCTENINECETNPCQNGAVCSDTPGSYKCDCPLGYGGPNCSLTVNECESVPCQNGGSCTDLMGMYSCQCVEGFTGTNCEVNIDDCIGVSCTVPNTECIDMVNGYLCKCKPGFQDSVNNSDENAVECLDINECLGDPCQNQGTCLNKEDAFECQCLEGYTGSLCETDIDECDSSPCQNGARCRDHVNGFTCECLTGYTGTLCETNIDDCDPQPCKNGGECFDLVDGYNCTCVPGWTGRDCQTQINECQSGPCQNGGICQDLQNMYECNCMPGFTGDNCEINIDECLVNPCENGGTCVDDINKYTCNCTLDWMGQNCTQYYNACFSQPCQNGGQCITSQPSHDYDCKCKSGFDGENCNINIDDCEGHSCEAYQVCVDGVNNYTCECQLGFTGVNCSEDIDECASSPCGTGTCNNQEGRYECTCSSETVNLVQYTNDERSIYKIGYEGVNCEININECELQPPICLNNGICKDTDGNFKCYCAENTVGRFCEVRLSYCTIKENSLNESVCQNEGTCVDDGPYQYKCNCRPGWTGKRCKVNINECEPNPCEYNSTCEDLVNDYFCNCPAGLTGKICETNIDECSSNPCLNNGECIDKLNGYFCNCTDTGFKGTVCEFNIDECESNPCENGATCEDGIKDYGCMCHAGYTGKNCEVDILECESSPCQNGGTCLENSDKSRPEYSVTTAEGYTCECVPGFTGVSCETNIDECDSNPCVNGECVDQINGYECDCLPGYDGINCDNEINECLKYSPCENGATCVDKLADYSCTCAPENAEGKQYGGKNCTIELVGCVDNLCQSEAVCVPYLNGSMEHLYRCDCLHGFTGIYCNHRTTVSFRKQTWMKYNSIETTSIDISFRFRTTLTSGVLVLNLANLNTKFFVLMLKNTNTLEFVYNNSMVSHTIRVQTQSQVALNDGEWYTVEISVQWSGITVTLTHPDCGTENQQKCTAGESFSHSSLMHTLAETSFSYDETSGTDSQVKTSVLSNLPGFVGCMQDITVNEDVVVPLDYINQGDATVSLKCDRVEQCDPDPCNGNGVCNDLWFDFSCTCHRPYRGLACAKTFIPATFGFEGESSVAKFSIPDIEKEQMKREVDLSVFIRTREGEGLLFYIGGDLSDSEEDQTYIAVVLTGGLVKADIFLDKTLQSITVDNVTVYDGNLHFVQLTLKSQVVTILVDDTKEMLEVPSHLDLNAKHLYMGGLPSTTLQSRKRRQVEDPVIGYTADDFKGTMQDGRLNGKLLQFYPLNDTTGEELPDSLAQPVMNNVREGEQTDDLCTLLAPCQNNGTCSNKFFNDYTCVCTDGYKGRNCTELDFCLNTQCPMGSTCNDLSDGFECVIPATFANSNYVQYRPNLGDLVEFNTFSVKFRTREDNGILFHALGPETASILDLKQFITLEIFKDDSVSNEARNLSITIDLGGALFKYFLPFQADGKWHELKLELADSMVKIDLDGAVTEQAHSFSHTNLYRLVNNSYQIFLGGVASGYDTRYFESSTVNYFKGCLDEARFGGVLLPFFEKSKFINFTASTSFEVVSIDITIDCQSDPVCDTHLCENGATCVDEWNAYSCRCVLGYDGTYCGYNIDDCLNNDDCQNGATCVDGIADFSCDCVEGFTGERCQENIDECLSDPCYNNGTCVDGINGFTCNCSDDYFGRLCEIELGKTCLGNPCQNNATCLNETVEFDNITNLSFNCSCLPGFEGRFCEVERDFCEENNEPCVNGSCESITAEEDYVCICNPGFTGTHCAEEIDECADSPCENGECVDLIAAFECRCFEGWEGATCELDIDECENNTEICANGGVCINTNGSYICNCTDTGYEGMNCTEEIDECEDDNPCYNDGVCENLPGSYQCNCTLGYYGENCESANCTNICENDGNCTTEDHGDYQSWSCACLPFYEGDTCDFRGLCVDEPCENGATCIQNRTDYFCMCADGWKGDNCTEDIDECLSDPCKNGATCNNFDGGFNCTCVPGYVGTLCEEDVNECESSPCVNGECIDLIGGYECNCTGTGFNGTNCEIDIDECITEKPCVHGECINIDGSYTCDCTVGYVGRTCHSLNPCNDTDYCLNEGACNITVDDEVQNVTVECTCQGSWEGPRCDISPFTQVATPGATVVDPDNTVVAVIIGVCVGAAVLIVVFIVVICLVVRVKEKRATRGTYSPSRQEMSGSRMDMGNQLKVPPPERLI